MAVRSAPGCVNAMARGACAREDAFRYRRSRRAAAIHSAIREDSAGAFGALDVAFAV